MTSQRLVEVVDDHRDDEQVRHDMPGQRDG
jgi:hypothetical protein